MCQISKYLMFDLMSHHQCWAHINQFSILPNAVNGSVWFFKISSIWTKLKIWRSIKSIPHLRGGYKEILEISRFDQILMMDRLPLSGLARQLSLWTKTLGPKPHRIGMMTILNNSYHFLVHANLTEMPELPVEEQFCDASVRNGSISHILPSIDSSSIDEEMSHVSSLRFLTSLRL